MFSARTAKAASIWAIAQGLLTAVVPRINVAMFRKMLSKNFENVGDIRAKPPYLRQLRAMGVGMAAAGITGLLLESRAADDAGPDEETDD
ncbi:MAG: hypothetical protein V5A23_07105 [Halobacteriales archaeon]